MYSFLIYFIHSVTTNPCLTAINMSNDIVQLGKLRPREFKQYAKGYIANYVADLGSSPDVSDFKFLSQYPSPQLLTHPHHTSPLSCVPSPNPSKPLSPPTSGWFHSLLPAPWF